MLPSPQKHVASVDPDFGKKLQYEKSYEFLHNHLHDTQLGESVKCLAPGYRLKIHIVATSVNFHFFLLRGKQDFF